MFSSESPGSIQSTESPDIDLTLTSSQTDQLETLHGPNLYGPISAIDIQQPSPSDIPHSGSFNHSPTPRPLLSQALFDESLLREQENARRAQDNAGARELDSALDALKAARGEAEGPELVEEDMAIDMESPVAQSAPVVLVQHHPLDGGASQCRLRGTSSQIRFSDQTRPLNYPQNQLSPRIIPRVPVIPLLPVAVPRAPFHNVQNMHFRPLVAQPPPAVPRTVEVKDATTGTSELPIEERVKALTESVGRLSGFIQGVSSSITDLHILVSNNHEDMAADMQRLRASQQQILQCFNDDTGRTDRTPVLADIRDCRTYCDLVKAAEVVSKFPLLEAQIKGILQATAVIAQTDRATVIHREAFELFFPKAIHGVALALQFTWSGRSGDGNKHAMKDLAIIQIIERLLHETPYYVGKSKADLKSDMRQKCGDWMKTLKRQAIEQSYNFIMGTSQKMKQKDLKDVKEAMKQGYIRGLGPTMEEAFKVKFQAKGCPDNCHDHALYAVSLATLLHEAESTPPNSPTD